MKDFLFHESLAELDPELLNLIAYETERQARKLVMVPSESKIRMPSLIVSKMFRCASGKMFSIGFSFPELIN